MISFEPQRLFAVSAATSNSSLSEKTSRVIARTGALSKFSLHHRPDLNSEPIVFAALSVQHPKRRAFVLEGPGYFGSELPVAEAMSYTELREQGVGAVDGVLADLGVCSDQLDDAGRGFSFQLGGPLDMRLDAAVGEPASALLARLPERELADLIFQYGEERFSRRIARRIVEARRQGPLQTTDQLADLAADAARAPLNAFRAWALRQPSAGGGG